jgi:hypothetical protein
MATLTLRDVPDDLHDWLKRQAEAHHRSVNKEVIALLETLRGQRGAMWSPEERYARLMKISRAGAARPVLDTHSEDDILGHDEDGLPR